MSDAGADESKVGKRRQDPPRRALAMLVAIAVVVTLGVGSLVDGLAMAPRGPASATPQTRQVGSARVTLAFSPAPLRAGQVESFILRVTDGEGVAVVGARAQCALSMPAMAMGLPSEVAAPSALPGDYVCGPHALDVGAWALAVTLTLPDGVSGHATFTLNAT